ncbi:prepilin peptidase [Bacillus sp. FJAT-18017]|uniref:prepilin peptidase n=1 Tax=Bacillus sp. FJAT-18017 TaxID=1705566 RepID=UPI0006AFEF60|nr:A24 family peptidase [Bacillus sp. FJAT-18017]ALC89790.1 prepilin peptidase [Bacillus sp. FJAT-18017]
METNLFIGIVFIYGITLGSFYNVVGLRVPEGKSIVRPGSSCPNCGHKLRAWELVPVFSYVFQRGKCRGCESRISPVYPIMELLTGILFVLAPLLLGWSLELVIVWTLISLFIIITVSDIAYMLIPDKILIVFAGIFLFERILWPLSPWWDSLVGGAAGFSLLLLISIISKGGMGGGDIKLYALIGFVLGTKLVLLSFFLSTLFGAMFGIVGIFLKIVKRRQPIPFGPFIALGTLVAYFFGNELIKMYLNLFI